ncbi:MAG: metal-sensing transcriptional repressor [Johnsonella sp.]|nr:metal-sensing transcriptional repressor [Johnsonella sp.]
MKADRGEVLRRLKTARGQIEGIIKMVEEDRYCIDISNQLLAASALLNKANQAVIAAHMQNCIMDAAAKGEPWEREKKIEEITDLLKKLMK